MHVEVTDQSRISLMDLLETSVGMPQHEELLHCVPSKSLLRHTSQCSSASDKAGMALTIENIRKGQYLRDSKLPFLVKLHEMLDDVEKTGDDHIVSWMGDASFRVHKPKSFMLKIVPYYFNQSKYKSFQRQLHLYDFVRTPRGINAGAYSHPKFIRGEKSLCLSLSPHKIKGAAKQTAGSISAHKLSAIPDLISSRKRAREEQGLVEILRKSQRTCTPSPPPVHQTLFNWSSVQNVLVTGASLAAEIDAKKQTNSLQEAQICPHTGDLVYAFGVKPFRYIEESTVGFEGNEGDAGEVDISDVRDDFEDDSFGLGYDVFSIAA